MMGGALDKGNVTEHSEYNVWSDPEATDMLLRTQHLDIVMVGLEATHQVVAHHSFILSLQAGSTFRTDLAKVLNAF